MQEQFWQTRWATGKIAFHEGVPNRFLTEYIGTFAFDAAAHVFVPLCGKTADIDWLLARGHYVTGIEFNRGAVEDVFNRLSLVPEVQHVSGLTRLTCGNLTVWHGDYFMLRHEDLSQVNLVYDRAALVALPDDLRKAYALRLPGLARSAPHLLITYSYDQCQTAGPPFSVPEETIQELYGGDYDIELLGSADITGPLADRCEGREQAWRLTTKTSS